MSVSLLIASMAAILVLFIATVDSSQGISSSNKHYSIQIDAGSQGTRVYVYQYDTITNTNVDVYTAPEKTLIQLGNKRVKPGISSFWNRTATPDGLTRTIQSLVDYAKSLIPLSEVHKTPISLKATAGLRVLPEHYR
jgi:Golgi nucleoside diphosphatase